MVGARAQRVNAPICIAYLQGETATLDCQPGSDLLVVHRAVGRQSSVSRVHACPQGHEPLAVSGQEHQLLEALQEQRAPGFHFHQDGSDEILTDLSALPEEVSHNLHHCSCCGGSCCCVCNMGITSHRQWPPSIQSLHAMGPHQLLVLRLELHCQAVTCSP